MCGIFGTINQLIRNPAGLRTALLHRGPDEQNFLELDNLHLFQARLAIQDLSPGGRQPMTIGPLTIVFNGEIYNHRELRAQYGLVCTSGSDTETLLRLYEKRGLAMLDDLDGMFAIALYDARTRQLLLIRDRAGEKPLYLYKSANGLAFSSELNALRNQFDLTVNPATVGQYVRTGFFIGDQTPYQQVTELPAGHYAEVDCQTLAVQTTGWWRIRDHYTQAQHLTEADALDQVETHLRESVRRRLDSSDLEVGVFLSGGIDSGLVTAFSAQHRAGIRSFTVSFADGAYDEAPLARLVADRYQTHHTEIQISYDRLTDDIEQIIANYGEPFMDSSAIPSYYVSQAARQHVTVVLTGDGADEVFAGYRRYVPYARLDFDRFTGVPQHLARSLKKALPFPTNKMSRYNYGYRLLDMIGKSGTERYLSATTDVFEGYTDQFVTPVDMWPLTNRVAQISREPLTSLQRMQLLDFELILPGDLLVKMDIAAMAHSLEGRNPFLSKELLEFAPGLPDSFKINGTTTKYLLRQLAKRHLPAELVTQPKRGFEVPLLRWITGDLKPMVYDYLRQPRFADQFVNRRFISDLLDRPERFPAEKRAKMLYSLFCAEVWYRRVAHSSAELLSSSAQQRR
jgi:asparagine synthase (glutamine-hydrolysing)